MKNVQMNISHFRFIFFNLKVFDEIVTPNKLLNVMLGDSYETSQVLRCLALGFSEALHSMLPQPF